MTPALDTLPFDPKLDAEGQFLLATIGLADVLDGSPRAPTQRDLRRARVTARKARRELRRFVAAEGFDKPKKRAPFNYDRTLETLTDVSDAARMDQVYGAFGASADQEAVYGFVHAVVRVVEHLRAKMPVRVRQSLVGFRNDRPSDTEVGRWGDLYAVATDPWGVVDDLLAGRLSLRKVEALEAMYPAFYEALKDAVFLAVSDHKARHHSWQGPTYSKDLQLRILLGLPPMDSALAAKLQAVFKKQGEKEPAPAKASPRATSKLNESLLLPSQRDR